MNRVPFTEGQLLQLQTMLQDIRAPEGLLRGLAGARCNLLTLFEKPRAPDLRVVDLPPAGGRTARGLADGAEIAYNRSGPCDEIVFPERAA